MWSNRGSRQFLDVYPLMYASWFLCFRGLIFFLSRRARNVCFCRGWQRARVLCIGWSRIICCCCSFLSSCLLASLPFLTLFSSFGHRAPWVFQYWSRIVRFCPFYWKIEAYLCVLWCDIWMAILVACCGISQFWSLFYFRRFVWIAICFLFSAFFFLGFSFRLFSMWASSCVAFLRIFILQLTGVNFCLSDVAFSIDCTSSCLHCVGSLWLHLVFNGFVSAFPLFRFSSFLNRLGDLGSSSWDLSSIETILPWIKEFLAQTRIECTCFIDNSP